jgi:ribonuclease P protein subunit POP4
MISPETLTRHELVGLSVRVIEDADDRAGVAGEIVDETTRTLIIETDGRTKTVPKAEATFAVDLPDGGSAVVAGDRLVARPARRTEPTGDTIWHSA